MSFLPSPPHVIARAVMKQDWRYVTFLHWSYEPEVVQALLPEGLEVETYDGKAWVGLVPFRLDLRLPLIGSRLGITRLPETNVRTYVTDRSGRRGVWFFSLDADHLIPVLIAQTSYRLPYFWSRSRIENEGNRRRFVTSRLWPGPKGAGALVEVELGEPRPANELTDFDHFLTARWTLFSRTGKGLRWANIHHDAWVFREARLLELRQDLFEAAGLPTPSGEPLLHYGELAEVRVGLPHRVR